MTNMGYEELAQSLHNEAWDLVLAAQAPGREEQEAMWLLGVSNRLDEIADALMAEARRRQGGGIIAVSPQKVSNDGISR